MKLKLKDTSTELVEFKPKTWVVASATVATTILVALIMKEKIAKYFASNNLIDNCNEENL